MSDHVFQEVLNDQEGVAMVTTYDRKSEERDYWLPWAQFGTTKSSKKKQLKYILDDVNYDEEQNQADNQVPTCRDDAR